MASCIIPQREFGVHEECGVFGIISPEAKPLARDIYFGLFALQHRGQESAGIAVQYDKRQIAYYKNMGLVNEVFGETELDLLPETNVGIGHVRYSTTGSSNVVNAQPVVFYGRHGRIAIAHNGNIVNAEAVKQKMIDAGHIFQSSIDSEVLAALINFYSENSIEEGIRKAAAELVGAFAIVVVADNKLFVVRDQYGLKPCVMGQRGDEILFASESCALDAVDAVLVRDVEPGELITVTTDGTIKSEMLANITKRLCVFEYVYLARSDSYMDGVNIYDARYQCGKLLAKLHKIDADIVAGVPDSALVTAHGFSDASGIPYVDALSKNRYIGRTFIQPSQSMRESSVKIKLNAFRGNIAGKRLILIDDSIVRGTTSRKIVQMLRKSGVKEVHMLVASPIVSYPCYFGVDMQSKDQLIGHNRTEEDICKLIGADSLHFLKLDELTAAYCGAQGTEYCKGCFDGKYPMDISEFNCGKFNLE
ncbi:MAG: amidophosphoribosyltransferase [Bacillota bacterium]